MQVDNDSSDSDGHGYDNNQEAIIIPITRRNDQAASTPAEAEESRTDNGVTMITFAKLVSPSQYKSKRKEIEEEKEVKIFLKTQ